jgi:hypothetical protein
MAANKGVVASVSKFLQFGGEHAAFLGLFGAGLAALVSVSVYVANLKSQVAMNQLRNEKELAVVKSQVSHSCSCYRTCTMISVTYYAASRHRWPFTSSQPDSTISQPSLPHDHLATISRLDPRSMPTYTHQVIATGQSTSSYLRSVRLHVQCLSDDVRCLSW